MIITLLLGKNRETGAIELLGQGRQPNDVREAFHDDANSKYETVWIVRNPAHYKRRDIPAAPEPKGAGLVRKK